MPIRRVGVLISASILAAVLQACAAVGQNDSAFNAVPWRICSDHGIIIETKIEKYNNFSCKFKAPEIRDRKSGKYGGMLVLVAENKAYTNFMLLGLFYSKAFLPEAEYTDKFRQLSLYDLLSQASQMSGISLPSNFSMGDVETTNAGAVKVHKLLNQNKPAGYIFAKLTKFNDGLGILIGITPLIDDIQRLIDSININLGAAGDRVFQYIR
jgi:hypothetical protein